MKPERKAGNQRREEDCEDTGCVLMSCLVTDLANSALATKVNPLFSLSVTCSKCLVTAEGL